MAQLDKDTAHMVRAIHWSAHLEHPSQPGCCGTPASEFVVARPETNGWRDLMAWATAQGPVTP